MCVCKNLSCVLIPPRYDYIRFSSHELVKEADVESIQPERKKRPAREGADSHEIAEYEKLLSERFTKDPSFPRTDSDRKRERRISQLYKKLFLP